MFLISTQLQGQFSVNFLPSLDSFSFVSIAAFFTDKMMVLSSYHDDTKTVQVTENLGWKMQSIIWSPDIWMLDMWRSTYLNAGMFARFMGGSWGPEREEPGLIVVGGRFWGEKMVELTGSSQSTHGHALRLSSGCL